MKQKSEKSLDEKKTKIMKRSHTYKNYASTFCVKILNSLNPKLQLKDVEYAITNRIIHLLNELKSFKSGTILVL